MLYPTGITKAGTQTNARRIPAGVFVCTGRGAGLGYQPALPSAGPTA
jgi:hypothetical protein